MTTHITLFRKVFLLFPLLLLPVFESYNKILGYGILLSYTGILLLFHDVHIRKVPKIFYLFIALIIYFFFSIFLSNNIFISILEATRYLCYFLIFIIVSTLTSEARSQIRQLVVFSIITSSLLLSFLLVWTLVFKVPPPGFTEIPSFNLFYSVTGHNRISIILIPAIVITFMNLSEKTKHYKAWILLLVFFGLFMILSFSRAGYLLTGLVFVVFLTKYSLEKNIRRIMIGVLTLAVLVRVLGFLVSASRVSLFDSWVFPYLYKPSSNEQRLDYVAQALKGFFNKPVFGWGLGSFYSISTQYASHQGFASSVPFNYYFEILAETGLLGFILLFSLFFYLIGNTYFSAKRQTYLYGWLICVVMICFSAFLDVTFTHLSMLGYFFIITASFINLNQADLKKSSHSPKLSFSIAAVLWIVVILLSANDILFSLARRSDNYGLMSKAIAFFPFRPEQYDYLSIRYFYEEKYDEASKLNEYARRLEPYNWVYYFHSYQIYKRMKKTSEENFMLSRVQELNPLDYREYVQNWEYNESLRKN